MQKTNTQIKLNRDLRAFGLNPSEWNILRERAPFYRVESRSDRNFVFKGKAKKKGSTAKWEQLELISL